MSVKNLKTGAKQRQDTQLYLCARQGHYDSKTRAARYVGIPAIEQAIRARLVRLSGAEPSRERFIEEAIACINGEILRRAKAAEAIGNRLTALQAEITNLAGVDITTGREFDGSCRGGA